MSISLIEFLNDPLSLQYAFATSIVLALLTLPLRDFISVGFYDISDFFVTGLIAFFMAYGAVEAERVSLTPLSFSLLFLVVMVVIMLMNILVILPFKERAENSNVSSIKNLEGKEAIVSIPISIGQTGEVIMNSGFTRVNRMARIYENTDGIAEIAKGENVLVIDVKDKVLYVLPYENSIQALQNKQ